ncbi:hypothetical protein ElyMa_004252000 [Elysia marginata]|uniref:Uncharacterized protein n=1 Tax=Elysia marginata TaxID=1093978 RepID=A0AAV4GV63_9GAST|nr:hypothetical protein ElyMa_004252000 [Elysia marginata]
MAYAAQIAKLLNQFRDMGMRALTLDNEIESVIADYTKTRDREVDEEDEYQSLEENIPLPAPLSPLISILKPEASEAPVSVSLDHQLPLVLIVETKVEAHIAGYAFKYSN